MRLVEQFEEDVIGLFLIARGNLLPDAQESGLVVVRVREQFLVVVCVDHHRQLARERACSIVLAAQSTRLKNLSSIVYGA